MSRRGASFWSDRRFRQSALITGAAILLYLAIRNLPTTDNHLSYADFELGGAAVHDFCEPGSASFVPVESVRSPVTLSLEPNGTLEVGQPTWIRADLEAASGRPLTVEDLLVVHTRKLHLLVADPGLTDYQHLHPEATEEPGVFRFEFTPALSGRYRVYADFMPRATGRGLYAGSSLEVPGAADEPAPGTSLEADSDDCRFTLVPSNRPVRINETVTLTLEVSRVGGGRPDLELIMDAYAHMVAFDFDRQGFAHLHPRERVPVEAEGGAQRLSFTLNLPDPGWYRIWAQVQVAGREVFAPFTLEVIP